MPGGMTAFTLSFVSDGKVLTSRTFSYGASFDSSVYPPLPEKDGIYAHWDRTDLRDLHLDTVVTAVYDALLPTLSSEQTREDGRPVILAGGDFNDGDTMAATALTLTPEEFHAGRRQLRRPRCQLVLLPEGRAAAAPDREPPRGGTVAGIPAR